MRIMRKRILLPIVPKSVENDIEQDIGTQKMICSTRKAVFNAKYYQKC